LKLYFKNSDTELGLRFAPSFTFHETIKAIEDDDKGAAESALALQTVYC
jgi:hypothetical protein